MNRNYEVIALSVGGENNKIFKFGEKVTDANFGKDRADALVKGGFLKPLDSKKNAGELIAAINESKTVDEVNNILGDSTQATVKKAAKKKLEQLNKAAEEKALAEEIAAEEAQKVIDSKLVDIAKCETVEQVQELSTEDDDDIIKKAIEDKIADINSAK